MSFFFGSIGMAAFCVGWLFYRGVIKKDLHQHGEEVRVGAFFLGIWALVWWLLIR